MGILDTILAQQGLLPLGQPYGQFPEAQTYGGPHYPTGYAGASRNFPAMSDTGMTPEQPTLSPFDQMQNAPVPYANMGGFQPMPQGMSPQMQPGATAPAMPAPQNIGYAPGAAPQPAPQIQAAAEPESATDFSSQNRPQQAPMPPMDNGPGFIEKLVAAMNPALGAQNTAQRNQAQMARALYGALQQRGMSPQQAFAVAQAAATDPKMAEVLLPQALGLKPADTIEGAIARDMQNPGGPKMAGSTGNPFEMLSQLEAAKAKGQKSGAVTGETQATAEMNLPSAVAQAKEGLRLIGDLRSHKGREGNAWWHTKAGAYLPDSSIPGNTDARDAVTLMNQIKGGAFLEAFKTLKGGGQITEVEGKKATDAIARMDRSQSKAEFDKALSDYEGVIRLGIDRANQQAGRPAPNQFKGNSDWQQVQPGVRIRQVQ